MVERTLISFPSQLQLIDRLQHLLYLSSSITFISGEAGSGKSSLVEQLSNLLPDNTQQAFIRLSQPASAAQIRQQIITQLFEQPLFNAEDSLSHILLLLKDSQKEDVSRAVVIDNAGLLPAELLTELAEVIDQKSDFTDNEFSFILLSDDLKTSQMVRSIKKLPNHLKVATLTFKLAPLTENEAKQLLHHRFEQIGYSPELAHQDALALQLSRCKGIPEKILTLATQVSSGKLDNNKPSWLKTGLPAVLIMFILIFIATSLAYYLYPKFIKTEDTPDIIIETDDVLPGSISSTGIITETLSDAESSEALAGEWKSDAQNLTDNELSVGEADSQERVIISEQLLLQLSASESQKTLSAPLGVVSSENAENNLSAESNATDLLPETKTPSDATGDITSQSLKTETLAVIEDPLQSVLQQEQNPQISQPLIKAPAVVIPVTAPVKTIEKQLPKQSSANSELGSIFTDKGFLLALNPNLYTLQLAGFGSDQSLKRFIGQHQLPREDVYLYQTVRQEKPWYVVIYGQFESRESATTRAQNLPDTLNSLKTWAKKYALVHQDLQRDE
tara:strand:- start:23214 stop:24896 length:1683 start_codon:yes stop_codon:yes gene_type:complete